MLNFVDQTLDADDLRKFSDACFMKMVQTQHWQKNTFTISTDPAKLDLPRIHKFLTSSYWATEIPLELVRKSIANSLPFGIYAQDGQQVGFARVISDYATFAYLADVYVEAEWRGKDLSKWLMSCIMKHPELQGLRRWCLGTRDAHGLYAQFGFQEIPQPENWMEIRVPDIYKKKRA